MAGKGSRRARLHPGAAAVRSERISFACCVMEGPLGAPFGDLSGIRRGMLGSFKAFESFVVGMRSFDIFASALYRESLHFEED